MAEYRVTDDVLEHWASEAKKEPPGKLGSINLPAVVEMLIAEVRASRAREVDLADSRRHWLDRSRQDKAERDVLQQRIDNALAMCGAARPLMLGSGCHQPFAVGGLLVDADRIRAALTETAETAVNPSGGTGTPTGPVSGGSGQDRGQEAAEDDEAERTVAKFRAAVPDHLDEVRRRVHHAQRPCDAVLPLIAELRQARAELARYRASDA